MHRMGAKATEGPAFDAVVRASWRWALLAGAGVGLAAGFFFALRAGAVLAPLTVIALRAGVTVRRLLTVAAAASGMRR